MGQHDRQYRLRQMLESGGVFGSERLQRELGVSAATIKRDIRELRERLHAPIDHDAERGGWWLNDGRAGGGARYERVSLYFDAEEIRALLALQQCLAGLDAAGLLGSAIEPLAQRLRELLDRGAPGGAEVARRVRLLTIASRRPQLPHFKALGSALLARKRARIGYRARGRDELTEREVSPQRLVHYRDNWYLDAWCHWRERLRSFAVDAVTEVQVLQHPALEVPDEALDAELGAGYGIFAGQEVRWATLRFSAERARWVAAERWHSDQSGEFDAEGRYLLRLPFSDPTELVMDVLRHLPHVEVLGPPALDHEVRERVKQALALWGGAG